MVRSPNAACPCGSGRKYKKCCRVLHNGQAAPSAEALMRSRYSAYALGLADYVMGTTHADSPHRGTDPGRWRADLQQFCRLTRFEGLIVESASSCGQTARVRFRAALRQRDRDASFTEESLFRRVEGRRLYVEAVRHA